MSTEEEYNKLMSDKLNARSFEPSEQDWDAALALIEAHDKKKKRRFFFWLIPGLGLIITGAIVFALYLFQNADKKIFAQADQNRTTTINQTQNELKSTKETQTTEEDITNKNKVVKEQEKVERKDLTVIETTEASKITASENSDTKANSENNISNAKVKKQVTKSYTASNSIPQKKEKIANASQPKKEDGLEATPLANDPQVTKELEPVNTYTASLSTQTSQNTNLTSALANTTVIEKQDTLTKVETQITKVDSASKIEKILDPIVPPTSRFEFYALGSGQYTPVKDPSQKIIDKLNPMGGLYFVRSFVNGFGFGSGLFYSVYSASTLDPKTYRSVSQEFGYKALVTEIAPDKFHYARIPLFATYSFKKSRLFFGAQACYMVYNRSAVSTYRESYTVISDQQTKHSFGYSNGLNKMDVSIMFAYTRQVYQKFGLGIGMDYGFKDTKSNAYFGSTKFDRNMSFQLLLTYKLR